jgi:hypothetical protein
MTSFEGKQLIGAGVSSIATLLRVGGKTEVLVVMDCALLSHF